MIKNGAHVNVPDKEGKTPLHLAIRHGNADIAELLLKNGAEFQNIEREVDEEDKPTLHRAAEKGYLICLRLTS